MDVIDSSCEQCELLEYTSNEEASHEGRRHFFHSYCEHCASSGRHEAEPLCSFCKHLRLRHLLFCPDDRMSWCTVNLGPFSQAKARIDPDCLFCSLIELTLDTYSSQHQLGDSQAWLHRFALEFFKTDRDEPDPAKVAMSVSDGNEVVYHSCALHAYLAKSSDKEPVPTMSLEGNHLNVVRPLIHWPRIKSWISSCEEKHQECAPTGPISPPPGFRVIDIAKKRLVQMTVPCRFVALSYVWGDSSDPSKLMTVMGNVQALEKENALEGSRLPALIDEAIQACRLLQERYLWADRLCIIQDDAAHKQQQIESMVDIYSRAAFVMITAGSSSVDDPVPGISHPRGYSTKTASWDGLQVFTVLPDFAKTILTSVWASRGWTYQEAVLAKRKLYFTPYQIILECEKGHVYEDNLMNQDPWKDYDVPLGGGYQRRITSLESNPSTSPRFSFEIYTPHVSAYNARFLTYESDIYNGIAGILSTLYGHFEACAFGLPLTDFGQALLWYPELSPENESLEPRLSNMVVMPSWSWSTVTGSISHLCRRTFCGSVCSWALAVNSAQGWVWKPIEEGTSVSRHWAGIHDLEIPEIADMSLKHVPHISMAIAAAEGCFEIPHKPLILDFWRHKSFLEIGRELVGRWPRFDSFRHDISLPAFQDPGIEMQPGMLATRLQVASLIMAPHEDHDMGDQGSWSCQLAGTWAEIVNDAGQRIGMLAPSPAVLDLVEPDEIEVIGLSVSTNSTAGFPADLVCLIHEHGGEILSLASKRVYNKIRDLQHLDLTYRDSGGEVLYPVPVVNVMMIERHGEVCRRGSVGWILLTKWSHVVRKWENIVLV